MTRSNEQRVALVTGGGSGLGKAFAAALVGNGVRTFIAGRRAGVLEATAAEIGATAIVADITGPDLDEVYRRIGTEAGRLDIVVANAGTTRSVELAASCQADFDDIMGLNLEALYFTVQKALPLLVDGGSIVLIGSASSHVIRKGNGLYSASKAAVRSLARTWALELGGRGIRVNVISPGATAGTPLMDAALATEAGRARIAGYMQDVPLQRMGTADEVAATLLFLVSPAAAYISGAEIPVDGGLTQV